MAHHRADVEKEVPIGRKSPLNSSPEIGEVPAGRRGMTKAEARTSDQWQRTKGTR